jgi:hypothetical protein
MYCYMADIRHELAICPDCDGYGWYSDHDPTDPHRDGVCTNCPAQVQCEICEATGLLWKKGLEAEKETSKQVEESDDTWDMPF